MRIVLLASLTLLLSGCTQGLNFDSGDWPDDDESIEFRTVSNTRDAFQYGAYLVHVNEDETYEWENSKFRAMIQWSGAVQVGAARLVVSDATGLARTTIDFSDASAGHQQTSLGIPMGWTATLHFTDFTGAIGFQIVADGSDAPPVATSARLK